MIAYNYFELHRLSDGLVCQFDRMAPAGGTPTFQRRDQDLRITYQPELGWVAYDEKTREITGRSWDVLPCNQSEDHPQEGIWVSRKGIKSFVYELRYVQIK